jgi:hypothetical protein
MVFAALGFIGVALAAIVYPTWQHNKDVLAQKEFYHLDTPEEQSVFETQTFLVLGGFLLGGPLLLIGIVLVALAMSYNSKLDREILLQTFRQRRGPDRMPSDRPTYCAYCGNPTDGKPYCAYCGKKTQGV